MKNLKQWLEDQGYKYDDYLKSSKITQKHYKLEYQKYYKKVYEKIYK